MEPIPDLDALQAVLSTLQEMDLVLYLTAPGQRRGAVVTHNLYPPNELQRVRQEFARSASAVVDDMPRTSRAESSAAPEPGLRAELAELRDEIQAIKAQIATVSTALRDLQSSLGA